MLTRRTGLLTESKQSIVNLGFPEVVASIFFKLFPRDAFVLAKWFREYAGASYPDTKTWFRDARGGTLLAKLDAYTLSRLYETLKSGDIETHNRLRDRADLSDVDMESMSVERKLAMFKTAIEEALLQASFFRSGIVEAIRKGELKTLQGYDHLSFNDASDKFEEKKMFSGTVPTKSYANGWKWINAGKKCAVVGRKMKNCGSTGVMGYDPNIGMMTLFDPNNEPHVVAVYLPGDNQITNPEGQGSTEVKDEYLPYVLDLAQELGAEIRPDTKSRLLNLKLVLGVPLKSIKRIHADAYNEYFLVKMPDGKTYYSDGYYALSKDDFSKITGLSPKPKNIPEKLRRVLGYHNLRTVQALSPDVKIVRTTELAKPRGLMERFLYSA